MRPAEFNVSGVSRSAGAPVMRGIGLMVAAMALAPAMDTLSKYLSVEHGVAPAFIVFVQFAVQTTLLFVIIGVWIGPSGLRSTRWALNMVRGVLVAFAGTLFLVAIKYMPLVDASAIVFIAPMIVLLLSWLLLGETLGWRRIAASIVGFGGALMVIQPSYELFGPISLLPLAAASFFALYLILTRKFTADDHPFTMQLYAGIGGIIASGLILTVGGALGGSDFSFAPPAAMSVFALVIAVGAMATAAHLLITTALSLAPASVLAPFQYVQLVCVTLLGLAVFGEFPGLVQWIGIAIIVAAGLFVAARERQADHTAGG